MYKETEEYEMFDDEVEVEMEVETEAETEDKLYESDSSDYDTYEKFSKDNARTTKMNSTSYFEEIPDITAQNNISNIVNNMTDNSSCNYSYEDEVLFYDMISSMYPNILDNKKKRISQKIFEEMYISLNIKCCDDKYSLTPLGLFLLLCDYTNRDLKQCMLNMTEKCRTILLSSKEFTKKGCSLISDYLDLYGKYSYTTSKKVKVNKFDFFD